MYVVVKEILGCFHKTTVLSSEFSNKTLSLQDNFLWLLLQFATVANFDVNIVKKFLIHKNV